MIERMRTIASAESIEIDDAVRGIAYRADGGCGTPSRCSSKSRLSLVEKKLPTSPLSTTRLVQPA